MVRALITSREKQAGCTASGSRIVCLGYLFP